MPLPRLPTRSPDSHKGDYGTALLIGGSRGMAGAIALAGMACLRSGAGLVKLAVPECILDTVASFEPAYMTTPLPCDSSGCIFPDAATQLEPFLKTATCLACGPGLSQSAGLKTFVTSLYKSVQQPLVIDADGLNALVNNDDGFAHEGQARILTPHPGEFHRLFGYAPQNRDRQISAAIEIAGKHNLIIVLKGHRTIVTNGAHTAENVTGNPGMAAGGTGDVLTGIITALVCQKLSPFDAAVLGAHVHGLAG